MTHGYEHSPPRPGRRTSRRWWRPVFLALACLGLCATPARAEDIPRDIVLVLDVSRSMDDAFPRVIAGIEAYLADTRPDETLTLSTFGDGVRFVVRGRTLGPDSRAQVRELLAGLEPTDRFTNITYAVDRALSELRRLGPAEGRVRELILLTDGKHNPPPGGGMPVPTFDELRDKAARLTGQQWYVRYIVLGAEYDADMTAFAREHHGEATMLKHIRDLRLSADLADTLRAAWLGASVTIESVLGGVLLERAGQEAVVPPANAPVREGDRVLLGPDGYAILRTQAGALFGLNPDTHWVLEQARWHPPSGRVRVRGGVSKGVALATAADVPLVEVALAGPLGAVHTLEGTIGLHAPPGATTVAAAEAGATTRSYAAGDPVRLAADRPKPAVRPPGLGPAGAPRDPSAPRGDPESLPSAGARFADALGDWDPAYPYAETWTGWFEGWRPALETGAPLAQVPRSILAAKQPPRLTDTVITAAGTFEGDVISDDDHMIILQMESGLKYFLRRDVEAVSYAAFPLSSAKVEEILGTAEYRRANRADGWRELIVGTKLRPGDSVRTGDDSQVICAVAGQIVLSIRENTEMTIEDARRNHTTGDVRVRLSLDAGQLWNDVGHLASKHSRYTVETPQASCGVRGTIFTVIFDREAEESTVAAVDGAVQVVQKTEALQEVVVKKNEQATVDLQEAPVAEAIEAVHVQEWKAQERTIKQHREVMEIEYPPVVIVPVQASLLPSLPSPQRTGKPVVWTAGYRPDEDALPELYEYEFSLRGPDTQYRWVVVQPFGAARTWTWTGQEGEGDYLIRIRVRDLFGDEAIAGAMAARKFALKTSRRGTIALTIGGFWIFALVTVVFVQLVVEPKDAGTPRLRVITAPPGMRMHERTLPAMEGLRWFHEARIGRGLDCDLSVGDDTVAATQCRIRRLRFGPWVRTTLVVEPGAPVLIDGIDLEPATHQLFHMTRLRLGEYEVRFDTGAPPPSVEVICIDGRVVRGDVPLATLETARTIIVQSRVRELPNNTLQWGQIQQVRVYRTPAEDQRMLGKPGHVSVGGPLVRIWLDIDIPMTGRLAHAEDAKQGRFRVYTNEGNGLDYILINATATRRIRVVDGSERPATFRPRHEAAAGRSRLALGGAGPVAVGQQQIDESIARLQESRKDGAPAHGGAAETPADATPDTPTPAAAAEDPQGESARQGDAVASPGPPEQPPPQPRTTEKEKPPPKPGSDRYIHRRRKPRI